MLKRLAAAILLVFAINPVSAGGEPGDRINMAGIRDSETREFLARFQSAVRDGDRQAVARLLRFPVLAAVGTDLRSMDAQEFLSNYDRILTPDVVEAALEAEFEDLIINSHGVGLPLGVVWFSGQCSDPECDEYTIRVITINGLQAAHYGGDDPRTVERGLEGSTSPGKNQEQGHGNGRDDR